MSVLEKYLERLIGAIVAVMVIVFGAFVAIPALANGGTPTSTPTAQSTYAQDGSNPSAKADDKDTDQADDKDKRDAKCVYDCPDKHKDDADKPNHGHATQYPSPSPSHCGCPDKDHGTPTPRVTYPATPKPSHTPTAKVTYPATATPTPTHTQKETESPQPSPTMTKAPQPTVTVTAPAVAVAPAPPQAPSVTVNNTDTNTNVNNNEVNVNAGKPAPRVQVKHEHTRSAPHKPSHKAAREYPRRNHANKHATRKRASGKVNAVFTGPDSNSATQAAAANQAAVAQASSPVIPWGVVLVFFATLAGLLGTLSWMFVPAMLGRHTRRASAR